MGRSDVMNSSVFRKTSCWQSSCCLLRLKTCQLINDVLDCLESFLLKAICLVTLQTHRSENDEASTSSHPRQEHQNNYRPAYPSRRPRYEGTSRSERPKRRTDFALQRMEAAWPSQRVAERIEDFPFKRGDTVIGTVIGGSNGWRVALDYDQEILG